MSNIRSSFIYTQKFIDHNKKVFSKAYIKKELEAGKEKPPVVLFELNSLASSIISCSYLSNVLADEFNADIVAYFPEAQGRLRKRIKLFRGWLNPFSIPRIYKSFGSEKISYTHD
jgi:hypothetical protein